MTKFFRMRNPTLRIPIYVSDKAHPVGHVGGDTFYKRIQGSRHLLRKPPAVAFDISTLHDAEQAGAEFVIVTDSDTGRQYHASIMAVYRHGTQFNRGFGEQIYLPLDWWTKPTAAQMPLFAEVAA